MSLLPVPLAGPATRKPPVDVHSRRFWPSVATWQAPPRPLAPSLSKNMGIGARLYEAVHSVSSCWMDASAMTSLSHSCTPGSHGSFVPQHLEPRDPVRRCSQQRGPVRRLTPMHHLVLLLSSLPLPRLQTGSPSLPLECFSACGCESRCGWLGPPRPVVQHTGFADTTGTPSSASCRLPLALRPVATLQDHRRPLHWFRTAGCGFARPAGTSLPPCFWLLALRPGRCPCRLRPLRHRSKSCGPLEGNSPAPAPAAVGATAHAGATRHAVATRHASATPPVIAMMFFFSPVNAMNPVGATATVRAMTPADATTPVSATTTATQAAPRARTGSDPTTWAPSRSATLMAGQCNMTACTSPRHRRILHQIGSNK